MSVKRGTYKHYKGHTYEVLGVGHHSETLEELVFYKALYDSDEFGESALWARPKEMFEEHVIIDGVKKQRFEFLGEKEL